MREITDRIIKGTAVASGKDLPHAQKARLFIGIELPESIKARIYKAAAPVLSKVQKGRLTEADNYHLTVFFIGEVPVDDIEVWKSCVRQAASASGAFELILRDTGYFARRNRKILWFGSEASTHLESLYRHTLEAADTVLVSQGRPAATEQPDANRPFRPHVTLGREVVLEDEAAKVRTGKIRMSVDALTLFESKRLSGRLVYVPIARFDLKERV